MRGSRIWVRSARKLLSLCACLLFCAAAHAQTLARPNWVGSGLSAEPWWRNALFYRINPATFQDSDGDGKGDLRGIAQRMDHLQALAIDAIVLDSAAGDAGFDDLMSEATRRRVRVLVSVDASDANASAKTRSWLTRGCAGVWLRVAPKADAQQTAATVQTLRKLVDSFPGQRVLVEDTSADPAQLPLPGAQLVTRTLMPGIGEQTDALSLRVQMAQFSNVPTGSAPVLLFREVNSRVGDDANKQGALAKILAAALLLSRGAVVVDAGQEIDRPTTGASERVMQWTPSNVTRAAKEPEPVQPSAAPSPPRREDDYGAYVPYVAPKKAAVSTAVDLNDLPGFSTTAIATLDPAPKTQNVASEDADVNSLLNFYRRLSQLHHEDITLRAGSTVLLNRDADNVLAWLRKPMPGAPTSAPVFIAANLSEATKTLSFGPEAAEARAKGVGLHSLAISSGANMQYSQRPNAVTIAPWSVVVLSAGR